jgi:hypothetical protein
MKPKRETVRGGRIMKKLALFVLIMGMVLVSNAVGQEFTDATIGDADGSTVITDGVYEVTGSGADVWGTVHAFQYYYRELIDDGSMVARVVSNGEGSNAWAKGGVMIRQSTDIGSTHAITALTGSEGGGSRPTASRHRTTASQTAPMPRPTGSKSNA